MTNIHPEKLEKEKEVVALVSVMIFDKDEYNGMKIKKISSCKIIDDWGVTLKELQPMVFVGSRKDIESKMGSHMAMEWKQYDFEKEK